MEPMTESTNENDMTPNGVVDAIRDRLKETEGEMDYGDACKLVENFAAEAIRRDRAAAPLTEDVLNENENLRDRAGQADGESIVSEPSCKAYEDELKAALATSQGYLRDMEQRAVKAEAELNRRGALERIATILQPTTHDEMRYNVLQDIREGKAAKLESDPATCAGCDKFIAEIAVLERVLDDHAGLAGVTRSQLAAWITARHTETAGRNYPAANDVMLREALTEIEQLKHEVQCDGSLLRTVAACAMLGRGFMKDDASLEARIADLVLESYESWKVRGHNIQEQEGFEAKFEALNQELIEREKRS